MAASLTGISPRPMLMGAPHDALRASNAGVSLGVPVVMANRVPLCFGIASVSLPPHGKIMAGAVLWLTPARTYLSALFRAAAATLCQSTTSAPNQPASAIKPLMADAHSQRGNRGGGAERKTHRRRETGGGVLGAFAEIGCQHINELRIGWRLRQRTSSDLIQHTVIRLSPAGLHKGTQVSLHTAGRCIEVLRCLPI